MAGDLEDEEGEVAGRPEEGAEGAADRPAAGERSVRRGRSVDGSHLRIRCIADVMLISRDVR